MDRSQHTGRSMGANKDRSSSPVAPEVLRASGGADAPAVVALRAPLRQTGISDFGLGDLGKNLQAYFFP